MNEKGGLKMKKEYCKPEMNIVVFNSENVLTVSATINTENFGKGENDIYVHNLIDF